MPVPGNEAAGDSAKRIVHMRTDLAGTKKGQQSRLEKSVL
jgi:hypothetical protein